MGVGECIVPRFSCVFVAVLARTPLGDGARQATVLGVLAAGAPVCRREVSLSMDERGGGVMCC